LSRYLQPVLSLDAPVDEEADNELVDVVPDPVAELQLSAALRGVLAEELEQLLQRLTVEEREVLALRFGLYDGQLRSRQDAGNALVRFQGTR
jgi:RNA polymerase primary sigma factor